MERLEKGRKSTLKTILIANFILIILFAGIKAQDQKEPRIEIIGPSNLSFPELIFTANSENLTEKLNYQWSVSEGIITSGQGTPVISVHLNNPGQLTSVTVELTVTWNDGKNSLQSRLTQSISPPPPPCCRPVDEFGDLKNEELLMRLENFLLVLQNDPTAVGYIVFNRSEKLPGTASRKIRWALDYITRIKKIDAARIKVVDNGFDNEVRYRLYAIPAGAENPQFVNPSETNISQFLSRRLPYDSYSVFDYLYGSEYDQPNKKDRDLQILQDFKNSQYHSLFLDEVADLLKKNPQLALLIMISPEKGLTQNPLLFGQAEKDYLVGPGNIEPHRISLRVRTANGADTRLTLILGPPIPEDDSIPIVYKTQVKTIKGLGKVKITIGYGDEPACCPNSFTAELAKGTSRRYVQILEKQICDFKEVIYDKPKKRLKFVFRSYDPDGGGCIVPEVIFVSTAKL